MFKVMTEWKVYILSTRLNTLYTGITTDVERRLREHTRLNKGAKYLKGKGPLTVEWSQIVGTRSDALKVEYRIKQLNRPQKNALIEGRLTLEKLMSVESV